MDEEELIKSNQLDIDKKYSKVNGSNNVSDNSSEPNKKIEEELNQVLSKKQIVHKGEKMKNLESNNDKKILLGQH